MVNLGGGAVPLWPPGYDLAALPGLLPTRQWFDTCVALLHRQSLQTPQDHGEQQPIMLGSGSALLFAGRLDDRAGLARALGMADEDSRPDGDLVARALQCEWQAAPARLIADFALAAWDAQAGRLLLASDATGHHPLYYHRHGELLSFATHLPALLALPWVDPALDQALLVDFLGLNHGTTASTFFRDIKRVLPGSWLEVDRHRLRQESFWSPAQVRPLRFKQDQDYVLAAQEVLDQAVTARLRSCRPLPLLGSGGLDSSLLAGSVLRNQAGQRLRMVTMVPEPETEWAVRARDYGSEREAVTQLLKALPGIDGQFVTPGLGAEILTTPEQVFALTATPLRGVLNVDWLSAALQAMADVGAHAYLDGSPGNFTLTWDGLRGMSSMLRRGQWWPLLAEARRLGHGRLRPTLGHVWHQALLPWLRQGGLVPDASWQARCLLKAELVQDPAMWQRRRERDCHPGATPGDGHALRSHFMNYNLCFAGELAAWIRARFGLELRMPLFDRRVVEFGLAIPENQFLRQGQTRWLARRLCALHGVPEAIRGNTLRGAWSPEWFRRLERHRAAVDLQLAAIRRSPSASRLIDVERIECWLAEWPENAAQAMPLRYKLDMALTRALQVGAFIQWAEGPALRGIGRR